MIWCSPQIRRAAPFWDARWWRPPVPCGTSGCRPRSAAPTEETAFRAAVSELLERLTAWEGPAPRAARVLALPRLPAQHLQHAGPVGDGAPIPAAGGARCRRSACATATMADCNGCSYTDLSALRGAGRAASTAAPMVEEVYPAVRSCRRAGDALRQLQRRPLRQPHRLRQPSDGAVPPDPVL